MITVNLYYTGKNDDARKFAEEMEKSGTADKIRAEKGNVRYEYFFPMNDPETVLLIDAWENQEAIDDTRINRFDRGVEPAYQILSGCLDQCMYMIDHQT